MGNFLTCEQVAQRYGVKVCSVREWIKSNRLPSLKLAGAAGYRVSPADLEAFEKQNRTTQGEVQPVNEEN